MDGASWFRVRFSFAVRVYVPGGFLLLSVKILQHRSVSCQARIPCAVKSIRRAEGNFISLTQAALRGGFWDFFRAPWKSEL